MADYKNLSDSELLRLLKASDHAAFTEIFSRFGTLLFSITVRRLNDKEQSKDLVHDVFADIWEKRQTLNIRGNLQSFLITIVKNRILDHYRHRRVSQRYIANFQKYLDNMQDNADHLVRHNGLAGLIEKEIAALPEKMRTIFELSRKKHMNRKEIAEHLDIPEGNVKINVQRALKILTTRLDGLAIIVLLMY